MSSRIKSTNFLQVYLRTDWLVSKDAVSWDVGLRARKLLVYIITLPFVFSFLVGWTSPGFVDTLDCGPHWSHLHYWESFFGSGKQILLLIWSYEFKLNPPPRPVTLAQLRQSWTAVHGQEKARMFPELRALRKAVLTVGPLPPLCPCNIYRSTWWIAMGNWL